MEADRKRATEPQRRTFGLQLRVLRAKHGMTQEELAEKSGIARQVIGEIERAQRDVGISHVWALAEALDEPPTRLFEPPS